MLCRAKRKGSIAVESAFSFFIVFAILSATIDYGIFFHRQSTLTKVCATMVDQISLNPEDQASAIRYAEDSFYANTGHGLSVTVTIIGEHVHVVASSNYVPAFGFVPIPAKNMHKGTALIRKI